VADITFLSENLTGGDYLGDTGIDGRMIFKWTLKTETQQHRIFLQTRTSA
jgi:hypothetical protein